MICFMNAANGWPKSDANSRCCSSASGAPNWNKALRLAQSSVPSAEKAAPQGGDPKPGGGNKEEDHGHKPGAHGGIIVSLGKDSYHAEAVFEKGRKVRLYMLGKEETRVQEVDVQDLTAFVTAEGSTERFANNPKAR